MDSNQNRTRRIKSCSGDSIIVDQCKKHEYTHNEIIEKKRQDIENVLVKYAEAKLLNQMIDMGMDPESEEGAQMMQEKLQPENLKTLPEIQDFYSKDYEVLAEKWASKQHLIDEEL